jgi:hypothetical protein
MHYDSIQCTVMEEILSEVTMKTRLQMVKSETKYTDFTKAVLTFKMSYSVMGHTQMKFQLYPLEKYTQKCITPLYKVWLLLHQIHITQCQPIYFYKQLL